MRYKLVSEDYKKCVQDMLAYLWDAIPYFYQQKFVE